MSKEQTLITLEDKLLSAFENTFNVKIFEIYEIRHLADEEFLDVIENLLHTETTTKVLEALEEVDKYCDGKINHFSKAPMDLNQNKDE